MNTIHTLSYEIAEIDIQIIMLTEKKHKLQQQIQEWIHQDKEHQRLCRWIEYQTASTHTRDEIYKLCLQEFVTEYPIFQLVQHGTKWDHLKELYKGKQLKKIIRIERCSGDIYRKDKYPRSNIIRDKPSICFETLR